ncbi:MAG: hypothetical protein MUF37_01410 [Methanoregulaceae archaeon]|jgi:hypothetical protein|nr:hypothetical protein [Methanoregulaceae archaeon]
MEKSEIRRIQWEISESLFSSLKKGNKLTGNVGTIIRICNLRFGGVVVAKFLERAKNMPYLPFTVVRERSSFHGCTYRIEIKNILTH